MYDYVYNALSCAQSPHCTGLVSKYTIPPLIHFSSFLSGAYYFRRQGGMDTSRGLIEAVFLQSTKSSAVATAYGDLSQGRLTRVLRLRLWWGVVWLALRMVASGLSSLFANREPLLPYASDLTNTCLSALKVVSGLACDGVYALTITLFSIHCALLCFYIDGWRHRLAQRMHTLPMMKQQVLVIHRHLRNLNRGFGWPISLAFLLFAVEICIFAYNIIRCMCTLSCHRLYRIASLQRVRLRTYPQYGRGIPRSTRPAWCLSSSRGPSSSCTLCPRPAPSLRNAWASRLRHVQRVFIGWLYQGGQHGH
jgi:hypothetical protein